MKQKSFAINLTTRTYHLDTFGFIIKNGKIIYPVHEITIAEKFK
ncbi:metallopeptidase TldD-related protein [Neoehrlichia mikurensis]